MPSKTHTKRIISANEVPPRLRKKIEVQERHDRFRRGTFIMTLLLVNIGGGLLALIITAILDCISATLANIFSGISQIIIGLLTLMALILRCHDLNKSGWLLLLMFIPIVNIVFFLYLIFKKGTDGYNDYGAPDE